MFGREKKNPPKHKPPWTKKIRPSTTGRECIPLPSHVHVLCTITFDATFTFDGDVPIPQLGSTRNCVAFTKTVLFAVEDLRLNPAEHCLV